MADLNTANRSGARAMRINWHRLGCSAIGFYLENSFFGWNTTPQSAAELIADLLCLLIVSLSVEIRL